MVREVILQEGFLEDLVGGIKTGVGKAYDFISPVLGIEKPTTGLLKALDDLSDDDKSNDASAEEEVKKTQILGHGNLVPGSSNVVDSWRGRLGTETGRGINFHKLEDGRNNYRGGLDEEKTTASRELFEELKNDYGIRKVVTLNADDGGRGIPALVKEAGLESLYVPMGDNDWPSRSTFEEIKNALRSGNTLVHCSHGADRTGAIVGRYYIEDLGWDVNATIDHTKRLGGHKLPGMKKFLINGPGGESSAPMSSSNKEKGGLLNALDNVFSDYSDLFDSEDFVESKPSENLPSSPVGDIRLDRVENFYKYDKFFRDASQRTGVPFSFLKAIGLKETRLKPDLTSPKGAQGLMQFMPSAQKQYNLDNPWDPEESIHAAADYLKNNLNKFGSFTLAAAAYNAGPGNVRKHGGVPPFQETQNYVRRVEALYGFLKDHHEEGSAPSWS